MADGRWSPSVVEGWIDQIEALDKWCALFFADPLTADPASVEVIGGMYARIDPVWERSSAYSLTLNEEAVFRALAPGTLVMAIGAMVGAFSDTLIARELIVPVHTYPTGGTFALNAGEWVIGIQVP